MALVTSGLGSAGNCIVHHFFDPRSYGRIHALNSDEVSPCFVFGALNELRRFILQRAPFGQERIDNRSGVDGELSACRHVAAEVVCYATAQEVVCGFENRPFGKIGACQPKLVGKPLHLHFRLRQQLPTKPDRCFTDC